MRFEEGDPPNPESNTDTIASARDTSAPLTLMRISALRGSAALSCMDWAMVRA